MDECQKPEANRVPAELLDLVDYLQNMGKRADVRRLQTLLSKSQASLESLSPHLKFGESTYRRNLISEGTWYELLCICWKSGQRSPIHDHAQSTCGLKIISGIATETVFETSQCGQIKAVSSIDYAEGHVCSSQDTDVHQVSNLQSDGNDLVTLHIYSPPIKLMDTYSIFGPDRTVYVPKNENVVCEIGDCI